ncbi:MAG: NUDIX hydrolase [Pseudomonadota bacterium]
MSDKTPVPAKPASTVLLVRDKPDGLEVFMVVRHHQIDFASGALVFPGGKVDEADCHPSLRAKCTGVDSVDDTMLSIQISAIREMFEEAGVLLARENGNDSLISAGRLRELEDYRDKLQNGDVDMLTFVEQENLTIACDQLHRFAHWITPNMMPKRFDTHFFLARAPEDHLAVHDGSESVDSIWISPQQAIEEADAGKRTIIFPTRLNVLKLGRSKTFDEAVANNPEDSVVTVLPVMEKRGEKSVLKIPPEAGYDVSEQIFDGRPA